MVHEEYLFIKIISDFLNGTNTESEAEVNWATVLQLAKAHQVQGIVYYQCKKCLPENLRKSQEDSFWATTYYYANRKILLREISTAFRQSDLSFFCVKGYEVAQYYPVPALRTMGDCDIVVHSEDVPRAIRMLQSLGYKGEDSVTLQQWGCNKNGLHFEVHSKLIQEGEYAVSKQANFFNNYDVYLKDEILDPSFHFLFLLMHLRKHFLNRGAGIRHFVDLAVMIKNNDSLNWGWIEEKLAYLDLQRFANICFALVEWWFDIEAPVKYANVDKDFAIQITSKILEDGVFGFDNNENKKTNARTALIISKGPLWFRRIKLILQSTFLNYEIMRGYPGCEFIDGKPWLLPIAWIIRFAAILREKDKSHVVGVMKKSMIPEGELYEREKILKKMGLL